MAIRSIRGRFRPSPYGTPDVNVRGVVDKILNQPLIEGTNIIVGANTLGEFMNKAYQGINPDELKRKVLEYGIPHNGVEEAGLINTIVVKELELYIKGELDQITKDVIRSRLSIVNVSKEGLSPNEIKILDDAKKIPTYAAGMTPSESLRWPSPSGGYDEFARMGGGPDSFHDRVKINIETRGKMYDLFILLNNKYNGKPVPHGGGTLETKDILALTLVLCYGINFFNNIIGMVGRIKEEQVILETHGLTMGDTIDLHRKLEWDKILINTNQMTSRPNLEEQEQVIDLLSESESKIRRYLGGSGDMDDMGEMGDIFDLFPVVSDLSNLIQEGVEPFSEQLSAILNWGLICHAKASPTSSTLSPSMVEPNTAVNRGVATASLAPLRHASEAVGEVSTSGHPFALLKGELDLSDENIDLVIYKLHGNFSDKFINSFVLFTIWNSAIQGLVLARQQSFEIPDRREKTKEGGDGKPTIPVNMDDFLPAYLGIDSNSEAYKILKGLKGTNKYQLNNLWARAYISDDPPEKLIIKLKKTIGGFEDAYNKGVDAKMAQVANRIELWEEGVGDHLEPNYVGYNLVDRPNAEFPSQALQARIQAMKRTPGATWGPVPGMGVAGVEMDVSGGFSGDMDTDGGLSAFRKKKKKKKKKKPIRTRNRGKHKKPSKRETLAERTMRLRRKKQSRKRKQEKKEKKSKKRNKTNRNNRKDRTIRIGDSVEIHYN